MTGSIISPPGCFYSVLRTEGSAAALELAAQIDQVISHDPKPAGILVDLVEARDLPGVSETAPIAEAWRRFAARCAGPIAIVVNGISRIIPVRFALIAAGVQDQAAIFSSRPEADRWMRRWEDRLSAVQS